MLTPFMSRCVIFQFGIIMVIFEEKGRTKLADNVKKRNKLWEAIISEIGVQYNRKGEILSKILVTKNFKYTVCNNIFS